MTPSGLMLTPTVRLRRTPMWEAVETAGVRAATVYNHMLLQTVFASPDLDYRHLKSAVQLWDVSCQRQIELRGRDATRLLAMMTPRDIRKMRVGQCLYAPIVDAAGGMLNDPVILKLSDERYWLSISDSDLLMWALGLATGLGLAVTVTEADVSPLAIQGPRAESMAARAFGDRVRDIGFFEFAHLDLNGAPVVVARSGFSGQDGFEIYVEDTPRLPVIWEALMDAGRDDDVRVGCPNAAERIEAGLLSYGSDMTRAHNPFECGLERYCRPHEAPDCIGHRALAAIAQDGVRRRIWQIEIAGPPVSPCDRPWPVFSEDRLVGHVTSAAWSPDLRKTVALGMIDRAFWHDDASLCVGRAECTRSIRICRNGFMQDEEEEMG